MVKPYCFDKNGMKKGAWSEDEDCKLRAYIQRHGHWNWRLLPKFADLRRSGKSCRLRWVNYLKPGIKRGNYSKEEVDLIIELHAKLGNKWSAIAADLPGRTDNDVKNYWHAHLKKCSKRSASEMVHEEQPIEINPCMLLNEPTPKSVVMAGPSNHEELTNSVPSVNNANWVAYDDETFLGSTGGNLWAEPCDQVNNCYEPNCYMLSPLYWLEEGAISNGNIWSEPAHLSQPEEVGLEEDGISNENIWSEPAHLSQPEEVGLLSPYFLSFDDTMNLFRQ